MLGEWDHRFYFVDEEGHLLEYRGFSATQANVLELIEKAKKKGINPFLISESITEDSKVKKEYQAFHEELRRRSIDFVGVWKVKYDDWTNEDIMAMNQRTLYHFKNLPPPEPGRIRVGFYYGGGAHIKDTAGNGVASLVSSLPNSISVLLVPEDY